MMQKRNFVFGLAPSFLKFSAISICWYPRRNLGKQNKNCPYVSPDGKFLFYGSEGNIYWVNAQLIEELREEKIIIH